MRQVDAVNEDCSGKENMDEDEKSVQQPQAESQGEEHGGHYFAGRPHVAQQTQQAAGQQGNTDKGLLGLLSPCHT